MGSRPAVAVAVAVAVTAAGSRGPGAYGDALGHKLGTDHRDLAWGVDPEPDLATLEPDDRHTDIVADKEFFHQLPRQHQHGTVPLGP